MKTLSFDAARKALRAILGFVAVSFSSALVHAETLHFEDLPLNQVYDLDPNTPAQPDSFVTDDVPGQLAQFFFLPTGSTTAGIATVLDVAGSPAMAPGGANQYLWINNVNLALDFGGTVGEISFLFGDFGGNVNLTVNHAQANATSMLGLVTSLGGTSIIISDFGGSRGKVTINGPIHAFSVGGQELSIDNLNYYPMPEPTVAALLALAPAVLLRRRPLR